jgi:hypothetical protein
MSFETDAIRRRVPGVIGRDVSARPYPRAYTRESFRITERETPRSDHRVMKLSTMASIAGRRDRSLVTRSFRPLPCAAARRGRNKDRRSMGFLDFTSFRSK